MKKAAYSIILNATRESQTMSEDSAPANFEASLAELESLVKQMEQGDMTLEQSLAAYERGVELSKQCQEALKKAELRIKELKPGSTDADASLEEFELGDDTAP